ncbi:hypothetical protein L1987_13134 [Smallanthus sonchifolius]|uniref:Uncharacterized protein n=1 Tax=Smallanthus sonchifolius TaxID=185202 RepID=A0ACB9JG19_9ASTR|nr:hypothetical protein L1987_13134 [Smallanthus sonchifolius]
MSKAASRVVTVRRLSVKMWWNTSALVYRPIREANWLIDMWCRAPSRLNLMIVAAIKSPRCSLKVEKNSKGVPAGRGAMVVALVTACPDGPLRRQHLPGAGSPLGGPVSGPETMMTPYPAKKHVSTTSRGVPD